MIVKYNNKAVSNNSKWVNYTYVDPYNPLNLPPFTIRVRFTNGFTPTFAKGTGVLVDSTNNIWDLTYENVDWSNLLNFSWPNNEKLVEVLGANSTGVTNMSAMFNECYYIASPMPLFDTSSVTDMSRTFSNCSRVTSFPSYNTSNVTNMSYTFYKCQAMTAAPMLDTSKVTDMSYAFASCTTLTNVPLFNTSSVTNMHAMFNDCPALTNVPLFNTTNVTNMNGMFAECGLLASVPLFDTSKVSVMSEMFFECTSLTSVPLFNTSNITNMHGMFSSCTSLTAVPLLNTSKVTDMRYMFYYCTNVQSGALALYQQASTQTTPPVYVEEAFTNCGSNTTTGSAELAQIPTSWGGLLDPYNPLNLPANTVRVRTSDGNAPIKSSYTSYGTATLVAGTTDVYDVYKSGNSLSAMLSDSTNVIEILGANTTNITYMGYMFYGCTALTTITIFDTTKATVVSSMFQGCINVETGALALYNQMSSQSRPPSSHLQTFRNCGSNTQSGAAELAQIPSDWK